MTKYIVVVGGVISGVGKGVATASIGRIMQEYGLSVTAVKIDPYLNCDAGTLRPTEHGEVWVTEDGGETDQDLGNYERFLGVAIPKKNNITTGQIYKTVIDKERRGDFLGKTVQFIPHIPDEIKSRIEGAAQGHDICLVEIGGTVGDYENVPFLLAMQSLERTLGRENVVYILVTYLPTPSHIEEMKTKPTQTAIKLLEEAGIHPDFILCRGKVALDEVRKRKIEIYANIPSQDVISMPDIMGVGRPNSLYVIPLELEKEELGRKILAKLKMEKKEEADWSEWQDKIDGILSPRKTAKIAIIAKYLTIGDYTLQDSYISVSEALKHAAAKHRVKLEISWLNASDFEDPEHLEGLEGFDGIIVPGGFGSSGVEGKINAIRFCREKNIPFLGLCYGLQLAVVEFARNVCNLAGAHTTEVDNAAAHPVIDILPEQRTVTEKGATMRLGSYKALLFGEKIRKLYGRSDAWERHRHRYEVNPEYHEVLQRYGLVFGGMSENGRLVEFIELPNHKFFLATQAHPEFKSSLLKPAPLFDGFIESILN